MALTVPLAASSGMAAFSEAEWRVLIISCECYSERPLFNCHTSAIFVKKEFERCLKYQKPIQHLQDPGPDALAVACDDLVRRPTVNRKLFLYFAGHGFEQDGRNFMVPVSKGRSVCLQDLRLKLEKGCLLFVAWDACRVHESFYSDEPVVVESERAAEYKPLKTDYMYLFSCLSGDHRFDDLEFAKALAPCFSEPELKLGELAETVKMGMLRHRSDATMSLAGHPSLPPTLLGRPNVHALAPDLQMDQADLRVYWLYWTPCLYLGATGLDFLVKCMAAAGFTRVQYSTRVTFFLSTSSFFWAAFSHYNTQHIPSCRIPLANLVFENWETIETCVFCVRTPLATICQVFPEIHHDGDVRGACITLFIGAAYLVFTRQLLAVIRCWRDEASVLRHARAGHLWQWVFLYAMSASISNFRMLWDGSDTSGRWVELTWQSYLLILAFALPFTLVCRCDPICSRSVRCIVAYVALPASSISAVVMFVLWQGVALHGLWLTGLFVEYITLMGIGVAVNRWQISHLPR